MIKVGHKFQINYFNNIKLKKILNNEDKDGFIV